jgi:hypothetical protein
MILMHRINSYNVAQIIIKSCSIQLHKPNFKINLPLSRGTAAHNNVVVVVVVVVALAVVVVVVVVVVAAAVVKWF